MTWRGESVRHSNARRIGRAGPVYRGGRSLYPPTVRSIISDTDYRSETKTALIRFKRERPWCGTLEERKEKFNKLNQELSHIYGIRMPRLRIKNITGGSSGSSSYHRGTHTITMRGKLSVVTFLHEFGHALGKDEWGATRWSVNLFRKTFPREYLRLGHQCHTLVAR